MFPLIASSVLAIANPIAGIVITNKLAEPQQDSAAAIKGWGWSMIAMNSTALLAAIVFVVMYMIRSRRPSPGTPPPQPIDLLYTIMWFMYACSGLTLGIAAVVYEGDSENDTKKSVVTNAATAVLSIAVFQIVLLGIKYGMCRRKLSVKILKEE